MRMVHKLILGSGARVIALAANLVIGMLLMPYVVHHLGDRIYGYWVLIGTIIGYYGILDLGITGAIQYYVAKAMGEGDRETIDETISSALFVFSLIAGAILVITISVAHFSPLFVEELGEVTIVRNVILITGSAFALGFPGRIFLGIISANLRFDLVSLTNTAGLLIRSSLIVLVLKMGTGILGIALVTALVDLLVNTAYFLIARRIHPDFILSKSLVSLKRFKALFSYSIYRFITKIGDQLRFYFHSIIIASFMTVSAITHYTVASRLSMYLITLMIALFGLLSPAFSNLFGRRDDERILGTFNITTKLSSATTSFCTGCLILYGRPFIKIWMGPDYLDAFVPLVILAIGISFDVSQFPSVSYMYGVAKHKFLMYIALMEGGLNVLLSILFVGHYGITGVALGAMLSMFIFKFIAQPIYVCKNLELDLGRYFLRTLMIPAGIVLLSLVLVWYPLSRCGFHYSLVVITLTILIHLLISLPVFFCLGLKSNEKLQILNSIPDIGPIGKAKNLILLKFKLESVGTNQ